jgi:hypothetical protein
LAKDEDGAAAGFFDGPGSSILKDIRLIRAAGLGPARPVFLLMAESGWLNAVSERGDRYVLGSF